jgi:Mg-chelatase subunit ChlI
MSSDPPVKLLGVFLHLARASQQRVRPHVRDRLLVIAASQASRLELARVAAHCRHLVLVHNPQHMIGNYATVAEALEDSDFLHLLKQLQRRFPQEQAERMLVSLGIEQGREWETYFSAEEYAAALLSETPQSLAERYG